MGRVVGSGPPATFDMVSSQKGTETKLLSLTTMLASVPTGNYVACGVYGLITLKPWLMEDVTSGASFLFAKRELAEMLAVNTAAVAEGVSRGWLILTYKAGAGETGATVTYNVGINVSNTVPTAITMGAKSLGRYGGILMSDYGAGVWSVASQSQGDAGVRAAFAVHPAADATNGRMCWGAATFGGARTITFATVQAIAAGAAYGANWWTVNLTSDLGGAVTLTITLEENRWDVAPFKPALGDNQLGGTLFQAMRFGDRVVCEDGDYNPTLNTSAANWSLPEASRPVQRTTAGGYTSNGPLAPTTWDNAGWLTIESRNYLGARPNQLKIDAGNLVTNTGAVYLKFRNMDYRRSDLGSCVTHSVSAGTNRRVRLWVTEYCAINYLATPAVPSGNRDFCVRYCDFIDSPTAMVIYAENSHVVGNRIRGTVGDCIKHAIFDMPGTNSVHTGLIAFNFITNKKDASGVHGDGIQCLYNLNVGATPGNSPGMANYVTDGTPTTVQTFKAPDIVGNIFVRGVGLTTATVDQNDMQCVFMANIIDNRPMLNKVCGNVFMAAMQNGISLKRAAQGSLVSANTMIYDNTLTNPTSGLGAPRLILNNEGETGSVVVVRDNVMQASIVVSGVVTSPVTPNANPPTLSNNYATGLSVYLTVTEVRAALVNADIGVDAQSVVKVLAAFKPKSGGTLVANQGAVDHSLIDHRQHTYSASLLVA